MKIMSDYPLISTWAEVDAAAQAVKNGLPKANLSGAVQASLEKADGAVQAGLQRAATDWDTEEAGIDENGKIVTRPSMSDEAKYSLLNLLSKVAYWTTPNAVALLADLEDKLFPIRHLSSITAAYDQDRPILDTDSLDLVRLDLVVTANYSDGTSEQLADDAYTLSGTLTVGTSTITVGYQGKTDPIEVVVSYIDPQYQQCEWIGASGTQYIDTGFIPGANPKIEVEYESAKNAGDSFQTIFGTRGANVTYGVSNRFTMFIGSANTTAVANLSGTVTQQAPAKEASVSLPSATYVNQKLKYIVDTNGNSASAGAYSANFGGAYSPTCLYNLFLFCQNQEGSPSSYSVGEMGEVIYSDDDRTAHYVPCYHKTTGEIGLYEKISKTFKGNAGTGTFTKGADV